jgi:serine/threonine protein kinase
MSAVDIQREVYAIQSVCRIPHQNIVKVWRHGQLPNSGQYYIDMELCDLSLREFIRSGGGARLSLFSALLQGGRVAYAWKIMEKVAAGLEHIHGQGLVHRDIKPENSECRILTES